MTDSFWTIQIGEVLSALILVVTILAIYFGPLKAVEAATKKEETRDKDRRKREIFAALMRTRKTYMHPDHVAALNLIQLEFFDFEKVIRAYRDYIHNLGEPVPPAGPHLQAFLERRQDLFFDLLHEIAQTVGCNIDKRDLERLAYVPIGWANDENEIRVFRRAMIEVLHGVRPLPVAPYQTQVAASPPSHYPPPPNDTGA